MSIHTTRTRIANNQHLHVIPRVQEKVAKAKRHGKSSGLYPPWLAQLEKDPMKILVAKQILVQGAGSAPQGTRAVPTAMVVRDHNHLAQACIRGDSHLFEVVIGFSIPFW